MPVNGSLFHHKFVMHMDNSRISFSKMQHRPWNSSVDAQCLSLLACVVHLQVIDVQIVFYSFSLIRRCIHFVPGHSLVLGLRRNG